MAKQFPFPRELSHRESTLRVRLVRHRVKPILAGTLPGGEHDALSENGYKVSKGCERPFKMSESLFSSASGTNVCNTHNLELTRFGEGLEFPCRKLPIVPIKVRASFVEVGFVIEVMFLVIPKYVFSPEQAVVIMPFTNIRDIHHQQPAGLECTPDFLKRFSGRIGEVFEQLPHVNASEIIIRERNGFRFDMTLPPFNAQFCPNGFIDMGFKVYSKGSVSDLHEGLTKKALMSAYVKDTAFLRASAQFRDRHTPSVAAAKEVIGANRIQGALECSFTESAHEGLKSFFGADRPRQRHL